MPILPVLVMLDGVASPVENGLVVMSVLLGANHLAAALRSHRTGHWIGAAANALAVAFAAVVVLLPS